MITGLGIVCPVGNNVCDAWKNIINGVSGIAPIDNIDTEDANITYLTPEEYTGEIIGNMLVTGYFAPVQRPNGDIVRDGDLWWSTRN